MLSFQNDYSEGAHPKILERLSETNFEKLPGYGSDRYCETAAEKIKKACHCEQAQIRFISGGTQTNAIVIAAMLRNFEGVISARTGHIHGHEAGAVERTGHKVLELPEYSGKINSQDLKAYLETFYSDDNHEHMVFPGMVYISHPTEYGTLYTRSELTQISKICHNYHIPLFMDGARLGYGLESLHTDIALSDIAELCDVFYIGGTKVGALCGEAVVFTKGNMPQHFMTTVKQHGALLAKGRLLGIQFDALFTDGLYFEISRHAILQAEKLKKIFIKKGYTLYIDSPTNQQFVILENEKYEEIKKNVVVGFWERPDSKHTVVRFATSWATTDDEIDALEKIL